MSRDQNPKKRVIRAVHGKKNIKSDPGFELDLSRYLRKQFSQDSLIGIYASFAIGDDELSTMMRRAIWRSMARKFGNGVTIASGVGFKHLETFEIGDNVFIGAQAYIQGRHDGRCIIRDNVWIGPQSYMDARDLIIDEYVGWGPGAKVLGSAHTGQPVDVPIIRTNLEIKPVRIEREADIGVNSVILPGVTVGRSSIVGAGAVVTKDVKPYSVVVGVPAKFLHWRKGHRAGSR